MVTSPAPVLQCDSVAAAQHQCDSGQCLAAGWILEQAVDSHTPPPTQHHHGPSQPGGDGAVQVYHHSIKTFREGKGGSSEPCDEVAKSIFQYGL